MGSNSTFSDGEASEVKTRDLARRAVVQTLISRRAIAESVEVLREQGGKYSFDRLPDDNTAD